MKRILLASPRRNDLQRFVETLQGSAAVEMTVAHSGEDALAVVHRKSPDLVVVDDDMGDMTGLVLVRRLIEADAFIQTALMSDLAENEYHHRSEGLGVWMRLPILPGEKDAQKLLAALHDSALG